MTSATHAPTIGMAVTPETILAVIAPRLSGDTDPDELARAVERARRDLDLAKKERTRLESLYGDNAVPERRVIESRHVESDAAADLATAEHRLRQYQGIHRAGDAQPVGRITVRSPIAGTLVEARVAPGEFVLRRRSCGTRHAPSTGLCASAAATFWKRSCSISCWISWGLGIERLLLVELVALLGRQQRARLQVDQRRGHDEELAGDVEVQVLRGPQVGQVLVGDLRHADLVQVHLVLLDQVQEQVEWPLEAVQLDGVRLAHRGV